MISFKKFIIESDAEPSLKPVSPPSDIPPQDSLATPIQISIGSGNFFGVGQPKNMPIYNPYVDALNPGQENANGTVNGGGGFNIEKNSRDYLISLAKLYGIDIETQESMQQKQQQQQQPGAGGNPADMMRKMQQSGVGQGQAQSQPQGAAQMGGPQQPPSDHLLNQVNKHPAMYLLNLDQNLKKQLEKAQGEMQKWKTTESDPNQGKNWYQIWKDKQAEKEKQDKMNLSRQANLLRAKERFTDIYSRLTHAGLHSPDLVHTQNHLIPQDNLQSDYDSEYSSDEQNDEDETTNNDKYQYPTE